MAPLVVPNAVLVRLIWNRSGEPQMVNVLGARKNTASTIDQAFTNTLGAAVKSAFTTNLAVALGNTVQLAKVGVRDISTANRPEFLDAGAAVTGGATGNLLPPQVALCVTLRTAQAGKSFRGRYYQGGWTVNNNTATGGADAGAASTLLAFMTAVDSAFTASGLELAVVSRKQLVPTDVTNIQIRDQVWDTIRRRATSGI